MVASLGLGDKGTLFSMDALAAFNIKPDTTLAVAEAEGVLVAQNERCFSVLHEYHEALRTVVASVLERETIPGSRSFKLSNLSEKAWKRVSAATRIRPCVLQHRLTKRNRMQR